MTDRELLDLAAKAAGIRIDKSPYNGGGHGNTGFDALGNAVLDWHNMVSWNPLTDDGDALRLAVKIQADFMSPSDSMSDERGPCASVIFPLGNDYETISEWLSAHNGDAIAATRRAVVRAAAAIAKAKEGQS